MSPDGKHLVAGVGYTNREEYASIYVYEIESRNYNLYFKKKLNFHFKGVQYVAISPDNKYIISIGTLEEKSILLGILLI